MPTTFARVRDSRTGHHVTINASLVTKDGPLEVIDGHDAVDRYGKPLPAKPNTSASKRGKKSQTPKSQTTPKAESPSAATSEES